MTTPLLRIQRALVAPTPSIVFDPDIVGVAAVCKLRDCNHGIAWVSDTDEWHTTDGVDVFAVTGLTACCFCGTVYQLPTVEEAKRVAVEEICCAPKEPSLQ